MWILWPVPKVFSRAFRGDCLQSWDVHVAVAVHVIGGKSHLPGNGCAEHCWVGHLLCIRRGFVT